MKENKAFDSINGLSKRAMKIAAHYENMTDAEIEKEHRWAVKNGLSFSGPSALSKAIAASKKRAF